MICTSILGSLIYFSEISEEDLKEKYDLDSKDILNLQENIVKMISRRYFGEELSYERLNNSSEKTVNVCLIELFTHFFKNKQLLNYCPKDVNQIYLQEIEKIGNLIGRLIAEMEEGSL